MGQFDPPWVGHSHLTGDSEPSVSPAPDVADARRGNAGRTYWYIVEYRRVGSKVKTVNLAYLGRSEATGTSWMGGTI